LLTAVISYKEAEVVSKSSMVVVELVSFRTVVVLGGSSKANEFFSARGTGDFNVVVVNICVVAIVDSGIFVVVEVVVSCSSVVVGCVTVVVGVVVDFVVVGGCVIDVVVVGSVVIVVGTVVVVGNVVVGGGVVVQILCS